MLLERTSTCNRKRKLVKPEKEYKILKHKYCTELLQVGLFNILNLITEFLFAQVVIQLKLKLKFRILRIGCKNKTIHQLNLELTEMFDA